MKIAINKKYRYRSGEAARIICIDAPGIFPVIAIGDDGDPTTHCEDGKFYGSVEAASDLIEVREPREWTIYADKDQYSHLPFLGADAIRVREIID